MELVKQEIKELEIALNRFCPELIGDKKFISTWVGKRIKNYTDDEIKPELSTVIAEVCLMCGLEVYDNKKDNALYVAQMRMIAKFIKESYSYLTMAEIINAFYLNIQFKYEEVYKQYGKTYINCEFIGQVLSGYTKYKQGYINRNKEILNIVNPVKIEQKVFTDVDYENDQRGVIEMEYHKFLIDPNWNAALLLPFFYNQLEKDELIPKNYHEKFLRKAKSELLKEKRLEQMMPTSLKKIRQQFEDGSIGMIVEKNYDLQKKYDSDLHKIRNGVDATPILLSKQMAVKGYFTFLLKNGIKNIYKKE